MVRSDSDPDAGADDEAVAIDVVGRRHCRYDPFRDDRQVGLRLQR